MHTVCTVLTGAVSGRTRGGQYAEGAAHDTDRVHLMLRNAGRSATVRACLD
jgi:hypothetical protein